MIATRDGNHVESAMLDLDALYAFGMVASYLPWLGPLVLLFVNTDCSAFGSYYSMDTYAGTLAGLTQNGDWFKSGQIISARRSTHKTA